MCKFLFIQCAHSLYQKQVEEKRRRHHEMRKLDDEEEVVVVVEKANVYLEFKKCNFDS